MRKRQVGSVAFGGIAAFCWRALYFLNTAGDVIGLAEQVAPADIDTTPIAIEIVVLLIAIVVFSVVCWCIWETTLWAAAGVHGAYRAVQDRRAGGPERRQFQACLADINDCRESIEAAGFSARLFLHTDLYAKLTNLSECLAGLGIVSLPVNRWNTALVHWHLHLLALGVYAERGNIEAARRDPPLDAGRDATDAGDESSEKPPKSP